MNGRVDLDRAGRALGVLEQGDSWSDFGTETQVLFTAGPEAAWPEPYATQWKQRRGRASRAKVAVRYLNHIIKTGEVVE
jgi:hypothetical protein